MTNDSQTPVKKPSKNRSKARQYHETTVYKGKLAETLDSLYSAGHTVEFVLQSPDIRGFEVISYSTRAESENE